jgi:segregation and condensation protein A
MSYNVKLESFEGPLDLLLYLVRKNEVDIQEIPIILITQQYLEYIELMKVLNLDIAGEFLVMAATLMYLKSRALLPKTEDDETEDEENTLEELKKQLLEYQQYKDAAQRLREQNILEKDVFTRAYFAEPVSAEDDKVLSEASLFDLLSAFKKILEQTGEKGEAIALTLEHISIKDKISEIMQKLQDCKDGVEFESLFAGMPDKIGIITTFLALLELMKIQAIRVYQNISFSRIYVYPVDVEEANALTDTGEQT